jgi:hypothetical protein
MATTKVTPVQLLRSEVNNKRPDPERLLPGQPAVNINAQQPGLFFADQTGLSLFKVGPCYIGVTAPNDGATGPGGTLGNTLGELWLDTSTSPTQPGPTLKVYDGSAWINCMPYSYANAVVSPTAPAISTFPPGTMWWNSTNGLMYILYFDGTTTQWTQLASNPVA